jgi:hypothetical protein
MEQHLLEKMELKIYSFSVNVFSFVKSLKDKNVSDEVSNSLLNKANSLYSGFLDFMDAENISGKTVKPDFCIKMAEECCGLLKNIQPDSILLNEKVDLAIEANEIYRKLKEL